MTTENNMSRRKFLGLAGGAIAVTAVAAAGVSIASSEQRTIFHRIMGVTFTDLVDDGAWQFDAATIVIAMQDVPELAAPASAVRLEGDSLPDPVLVVHGNDDRYYAFRNICTHGGHKIDPVANTLTIECCSVNGSTYDYAGNVLSGPAPEPLTTYPVDVIEGELHIQLA